MSIDCGPIYKTTNTLCNILGSDYIDYSLNEKAILEIFFDLVIYKVTLREK